MLPPGGGAHPVRMKRRQVVEHAPPHLQGGGVIDNKDSTMNGDSKSLSRASSVPRHLRFGIESPNGSNNNPLNGGDGRNSQAFSTQDFSENTFTGLDDTGFINRLRQIEAEASPHERSESPSTEQQQKEQQQQQQQGQRKMQNADEYIGSTWPLGHKSGHEQEGCGPDTNRSAGSRHDTSSSWHHRNPQYPPLDREYETPSPSLEGLATAAHVSQSDGLKFPGGVRHSDKHRAPNTWTGRLDSAFGMEADSAAHSARNAGRAPMSSMTSTPHDHDRSRPPPKRQEQSSSGATAQPRVRSSPPYNPADYGSASAKISTRSPAHTPPVSSRTDPQQQQHHYHQQRILSQPISHSSTPPSDLDAALGLRGNNNGVGLKPALNRTMSADNDLDPNNGSIGSSNLGDANEGSLGSNHGSSAGRRSSRERSAHSAPRARSNSAASGIGNNDKLESAPQLHRSAYDPNTNGGGANLSETTLLDPLGSLATGGLSTGVPTGATTAAAAHGALGSRKPSNVATSSFFNDGVEATGLGESRRSSSHRAIAVSTEGSSSSLASSSRGSRPRSRGGRASGAAVSSLIGGAGEGSSHAASDYITPKTTIGTEAAQLGFFSSDPNSSVTQREGDIAEANASSSSVVQTTISKRRQRRSDLIGSSGSGVSSSNSSSSSTNLEGNNYAMRGDRSQVGGRDRSMLSNGSLGDSDGKEGGGTEVSTSLTEPNLRSRLAGMRASRAKTAVGGEGTVSEAALWGNTSGGGASGSSGSSIVTSSSSSSSSSGVAVRGTSITIPQEPNSAQPRISSSPINAGSPSTTSTATRRQSTWLSEDIKSTSNATGAKQSEGDDAPGVTLGDLANSDRRDLYSPNSPNANGALANSLSFRMTGRRSHPIRDSNGREPRASRDARWSNDGESSSPSRSPQRKEAFTEAMIQAASEKASALVKDAEDRATKAIEAVEKRARADVQHAERATADSREKLRIAEAKISEQQQRIKRLEEDLVVQRQRNASLVSASSPSSSSSSANISTPERGTAFEVEGLGRSSTDGAENSGREAGGGGGEQKRRSKLMARLSMSASERRSLQLVQPKDPALAKVLQGDEKLPFAKVGSVGVNSPVPLAAQGMHGGAGVGMYPMPERGPQLFLQTNHQTAIPGTQKMQQSGVSMSPDGHRFSANRDDPLVFRTASGRGFSGGGLTNSLQQQQQQRQQQQQQQQMQQRQRQMQMQLGPRCDTCGRTTDLEPDEDNPGIFYCCQCWLEYEQEEHAMLQKEEQQEKAKHSSQQRNAPSAGNQQLGYDRQTEGRRAPFGSGRGGGDDGYSAPPMPHEKPALARGSSNPETTAAATRASRHLQLQQRQQGSPQHPRQSGNSDDTTPMAVNGKQQLVPSPVKVPSNKAWVLSDNTHLLNQVSNLMTADRGAVFAMIEAKMSSGRVRFVVGTIVAVGACNKSGSAGANLGTEVVTATTPEASKKGFVHFDGQRGSMYIELGSMVGFDKSLEETKQETIGNFRGMRLDPNDPDAQFARLDGSPLEDADKGHFGSSGEDSKRDDQGEFAYRDLGWFLASASARIDVVLVPQQKGTWYPYWEVSSGRKMAPQFRSSGVGYLRLADDMGKHGKCFISIDGGRSYLDDAAFDGAAEHTPSGLGNSIIGSSMGRGGSGGSRSRRRGGKDGGGSGGESSTGPQSRLVDAKAAANSVSTAVSQLKTNRHENLKWKEKVELLRSIATGLDRISANVAHAYPGGMLPLSKTEATLAAEANLDSAAGATDTDSSTLKSGGISPGMEALANVGVDEALEALALVQDILGERSKNVHVLSTTLQVLRGAGLVLGDKATSKSSSWRIVFPALLTLLRDKTGKVVAASALAAADALHMRCFRLGDASSFSFIAGELQQLGGSGVGGGSNGQPSKAPRAVSGVAMVTWLLRALQRERSVWHQLHHAATTAKKQNKQAKVPALQLTQVGSAGPGPAVAESIATHLVPLLAHREHETKEASAQALATLLLAAETQQSSSSSSAHSLQDVLLPVNKNNPKMYARIVTLIDEGRKRGEHLPTPRGVPAGSALPSMLMMTGSENNGMIQGGLNLAGTAMQPMVQSPQPYVSGGGAAIGVDLTKLQQQWGEVVFVMKSVPSSARELEGCEEQANRGANFLATLFRTARRLKMRKGALSRAVLPFDDQTSLADQSNLSNRRTHSLEAQNLLARGVVTEDDLQSLAVEAVSLRALLRVKIADDADLDQADAAVQSLLAFLTSLKQAAGASGQHPFELLQRL